MKRARLMIGLLCLAGLVGCEELDQIATLRNIAPSVLTSAAPALGLDADKTEYGAQLSAHHRDGHDGGPGGGGGGGPSGCLPNGHPCR